MNMPSGKGIMIWKSRQCLDGTIEAIVADCVAMGLSWVALKIGDGTNDKDYASFPGKMPAAVAAFRAAGIRVWGWHYIYGGVWIDKARVPHAGGASPAQEAAFARRQVHELELDGYLIDGEKEFKVLSQAARADAFMDALGDLGMPVGLCSYRFPKLHATFPWQRFLEGCDFHAPQVYHGKGRGIIDLERSCSELLALKSLPIVPVGRAYIGDGYGEPGISGQEMLDFTGRVQMKGCPGVSYWAMDFLTLHEGGSERREAIRAYAWGELPLPPPPPSEGVGIRMRVGVPKLNVRSGPGVGYADIGDLYGNEVVEVSNVAGPDAWVEIGPGRWACVQKGREQYLVKLPTSDGA